MPRRLLESFKPLLDLILDLEDLLRSCGVLELFSGDLGSKVDFTDFWFAAVLLLTDVSGLRELGDI